MGSFGILTISLRVNTTHNANGVSKGNDKVLARIYCHKRSARTEALAWMSANQHLTCVDATWQSDRYYVISGSEAARIHYCDTHEAEATANDIALDPRA